MDRMKSAPRIAASTDQDIQPGKIRFHVVEIEQASVSQRFVDRLRAIGADAEAVEFAQRQVPAVGAEAEAPEATA